MRRLTVSPRRRQNLAGALLQDAESGAIGLLVALLAGGGVLLGMAALTVDVGVLLAERRQVQNGADAAALALALDCTRAATCDVSTTGAARTIANSNANDSATRVLDVCGSGLPGLPGCAAQTGPELRKCPDPPSGVSGFVRVRTATAEPGGGTLLPPTFARALAGNSSYAGTEVGACAQAAWGTPSGLGTIPITISQCEWEEATHNGTSYPTPLPPYPPWPAAPETILYSHTPNEHGGCPPTSANHDLPGGFGWLKANASCNVISTSTGTVFTDTGASPTSCVNQSWLLGYLNQTIFVPVYSNASGTGSNGTYQISGYAAFYLTGWYLGGSEKQKSSKTNVFPCNGSDRCISGYFTKGMVPGGGSLGTGTYMGVGVVALLG